MVRTPNDVGQLSEEELNDFESANQIQLPADYKAFLLQHNGGEPLKQKIERPSTIVRHILGMHNGAFEASLYKHITAFADRLPLALFPLQQILLATCSSCRYIPKATVRYISGNTKESQKFQTGITLTIPVSLPTRSVNL